MEIPESWPCIDCGVNTAPGCSTRRQLEQAFPSFEKNPDSVTQRFDENSEVYTVKLAIWKSAGMKPWGGCPCIGCLEKRLGRMLTPRDFVRSHPFNDLPGTERLRSRRE